ncbi:hypothetical protein SAMN05444392_104206 [Seinonella peptonophila]|uniref:Uncharacterized protein n=1 Tax=Seinonella peptonophila TaxID=112248 RepID=A0A1M4X933_9BACL|nr:hypothetical protein [Seinonella peptonophila]SHE90014.1 hypothetical protein SAMN05444392_104206 [Seinonella peptonophila]
MSNRTNDIDVQQFVALRDRRFEKMDWEECNQDLETLFQTVVDGFPDQKLFTPKLTKARAAFSNAVVGWKEAYDQKERKGETIDPEHGEVALQVMSKCVRYRNALRKLIDFYQDNIDLASPQYLRSLEFVREQLSFTSGQLEYVAQESKLPNAREFGAYLSQSHVHESKSQETIDWDHQTAPEKLVSKIKNYEHQFQRNKKPIIRQNQERSR